MNQISPPLLRSKNSIQTGLGYLNWISTQLLAMSINDYAELLQLVKSGYAYDLKSFLSLSRDHPIDLNREDPRTQLTPLMVACKSNQSRSSIIEVLIDKGAEVDYQYNHQGSALMRAVEIGNIEAVETLISCGAQVDLENSGGKSALEIACEKGNAKVVNGFLRAEGIRGILIKGKEVDYKDGYSVSHSPFNIAVKYDHIESVKKLLKRVKVIPVDALLLAIYNDSSEMVQLLLNHVSYSDFLDDFRRKYKVSALMLAASTCKGKVEIVKKLLERGADVNMKGEGGSTALLSVLSAEDNVVPQQSKIDIVKLLLERGAHVDVQDDEQHTPLKCAIKSRSAEIVKLLIEKDNDLVYRLDRSGEDLLEGAYSSPDVLQLLLAARADPNVHGSHGRVHLLTVRDANIAKLLIDYGANVDQQDEFGTTYPLLKAVKESNYKLAELLLENGAAYDTLVKGGESAMSNLQRNPGQILVSTTL